MSSAGHGLGWPCADLATVRPCSGLDVPWPAWTFSGLAVGWSLAGRAIGFAGHGLGWPWSGLADHEQG
jgi:hypothetical protein